MGLSLLLQGNLGELVTSLDCTRKQTTTFMRATHLLVVFIGIQWHAIYISTVISHLGAFECETCAMK